MELIEAKRLLKKNKENKQMQLQLQLFYIVGSKIESVNINARKLELIPYEIPKKEWRHGDKALFWTLNGYKLQNVFTSRDDAERYIVNNLSRL